MLQKGRSIYWAAPAAVPIAGLFLHIGIYIWLFDKTFAMDVRNGNVGRRKYLPAHVPGSTPFECPMCGLTTRTVGPRCDECSYVAWGIAVGEIRTTLITFVAIGSILGLLAFAGIWAEEEIGPEVARVFVVLFAVFGFAFAIAMRGLLGTFFEVWQASFFGRLFNRRWPRYAAGEEPEQDEQLNFLTPVVIRSMPSEQNGSFPAIAPLPELSQPTTIEFNCPQCHRSISIGTEHCGEFGNCQTCETRIKIPFPENPKEPLPSTNDNSGEFSTADFQFTDPASSPEFAIREDLSIFDRRQPRAVRNAAINFTVPVFLAIVVVCVIVAFLPEKKQKNEHNIMEMAAAPKTVDEPKIKKEKEKDTLVSKPKKPSRATSAVVHRYIDKIISDSMVYGVGFHLPPTGKSLLDNLSETLKKFKNRKLLMTLNTTFSKNMKGRHSIENARKMLKDIGALIRPKGAIYLISTLKLDEAAIVKSLGKADNRETGSVYTLPKTERVEMYIDTSRSHSIAILDNSEFVFYDRRQRKSNSFVVQGVHEKESVTWSRYGDVEFGFTESDHLLVAIRISAKRRD